MLQQSSHVANNNNKNNNKNRETLRTYQRTKEAVEHENDGGTNCNWCARNDPKSMVRGLEEMKIRGQAKTIQTTPL